MTACFLIHGDVGCGVRHSVIHAWVVVPASDTERVSEPTCERVLDAQRFIRWCPVVVHLVEDESAIADNLERLPVVGSGGANSLVVGGRWSTGRHSG